MEISQYAWRIANAEHEMNWTCEQTEARLSDYLDRVLLADELAAFDAHVGSCARCTPMVGSVSQLLSGLHSMEQVEPPPRLVYSILDKTLGPRESLTFWGAALERLRGIASVRFAYGALSVAATFVIVLSGLGFSWRKPKLADLEPASIYRSADRQVHLVYARSTKFFSDLRVVHEIQSRLNQDSQIPTNPESTAPEPVPEKQPGRTDGKKPSSPRQQNRANDLAKQIEILAMSTLSHSTLRSMILSAHWPALPASPVLIGRSKP
jgi:anti-sigma factor RsiW